MGQGSRSTANRQMEDGALGYVKIVLWYLYITYNICTNLLFKCTPLVRTGVSSGQLGGNKCKVLHFCGPGRIGNCTFFENIMSMEGTLDKTVSFIKCMLLADRVCRNCHLHQISSSANKHCYLKNERLCQQKMTFSQIQQKIIHFTFISLNLPSWKNVPPTY